VIRHSRPNLDKLHREAQHLSSAITDASTLAASISNKVHILDTGKRNVFGALKRVGDIIDLKNCVSGVDVAMDCGNYEDAAAHIRRYLDLDESVLSESSYVTTTKGIVGSYTTQHHHDYIDMFVYYGTCSIVLTSQHIITVYNY
jgi:hypothetical protein